MRERRGIAEVLVIRAVAEYAVLDLGAVLARLDESAEFNFAGASQVKPAADHYNWLLRGRSHVPENIEQTGRATHLRNEWTAGPGQPSYLSLGDLTVAPTTLELTCMSRERLVAGRKLLEELLAGQIVHRGDSYADIIEQARQSPRAIAAPRLSEIDPNARQVEIELLARAAEAWLESPLPNLDNQTPRAAAKTAAGRAQLEEVFKLFEFFQEEDPNMRYTPYSAQALRRELGLG